ncbi:hypothetical protein SAMN05421663_103400 [Terribacillus halophilus]|uniref:Uncharacterized protein n=1 Tax=Terribacillus halophilus TaxID=361279 RepID=A0A1G6NRN2_9BACI|nr:hypothetical protein [Terribacillus halophilus]SDC70321.1 hypothetical protein SAMN05421663_103400 [Terribacillus halophilus]
MIFLIALAGLAGFILIALADLAAGGGRAKVRQYLAAGIVAYIVLLITIYFVLPAFIIQNILWLNAIGIFFAAFGLFANDQTAKKKRNIGVSLAGVLVALLVIGGIVCVIANFAVYQSTYDHVVQSTEEVAKPLDEDKTPIAIAPSSVRNKMNKKMSVVPDTQLYHLGSLQTQTVGGTNEYIAAVEFDGFFKWLKGGETKGYFVIDATDLGAQPEFVEDELSYVPSAYFHKDLKRIIYSRYPSYIQEGEARLEVDEEGKAWYVQTVYQPKLFTQKANGDDIQVVVVNPYNGESAIYDADEAPDFIENTISPEMASKLNTYYGEYSGGFWNRHFGKAGVKIPNDNGTEHGVTAVFAEDGSIQYFTDFKSPKENIDSALGYSMVDGRTGEVTFYGGEKNNGIMDSSGAVEVVEKEYPEKKWEGKMPVLYNIDGNPTWVISVLDSNGIFKQYAYVRAADSDYVVFGEDAKSTLEAYRLQLATDTSTAESTGDAPVHKVSGEVNRLYISGDNAGSKTIQFLLTDQDVIYSINATDAPYAIFLKEGDQVSFEAAMHDGAKSATIEQISIEGLN